jgi:hypothetical protein
MYFSFGPPRTLLTSFCQERTAKSNPSSSVDGSIS